jgi:hypothetical protein
MSPTHQKKKMKFGAIVQVKASSVYSSALIRTSFPNKNPNKWLTGIALCLEEQLIHKKMNICVVFQCDEVMNGNEHHDLYTNKRNFAIITEGAPSAFFIDAFVNETPTNNNQPLPTKIMNLQNIGRPLNNDDILTVRDLIPIEDNNKPAPENVPVHSDTAAPSPCVYAEEWKDSGMC